MHFSESALAAKVRCLDAIDRDPHVLTAVLQRRTHGARYRCARVARPWEPGGGASLFVVSVGSERWFLKVKALAVTVESKLESEDSFSDVPALRNEFELLQRVTGLSPHTPQWFAYEEEEGYGFLFLEHLTGFAEGVRDLDARALVDVYTQIEETVRRLHAAGIVHTDIHEHNVLFRGTVPVLTDFEEARALRQDLPFAESLDVVGQNRYGDVGAMPHATGSPPGRTCLRRLREVLTGLVEPRLEALVRRSRFDSSCPFLTALDHGVDERVYQSIDVPGLQVSGQRPLDDSRIALIRTTADDLFDRPYVHLDVGCNLGRFNLEMARSSKVEKSIGVDACQTYVDLATCLAFVSGASKTTFVRAVVGTDRLADLLAHERIDLVTVCSVYHHVAERESFLEDLRRLRPRHILFELAVQTQCYEGRSWREELEIVCRRLEMPEWTLIGESADYGRPVVLVSRARPVHDARSQEPARAPALPAAFPSAASAAPLVSVVLPSYNHVEFLPEAVQSVLAQTFARFELIIVDDGSTDDTGTYLASLTDPRVRVIRRPHQGLPRTLNAGFAAARGTLHTWISADNYAAPLFLEALVGALETHPEAGLAYSAFAWVDERDRITGVHRDQDFSYRSVLTRNPGNASFLYRRRCQEPLGPYDPDLEGAEDWDMWLRLVERFPTVYVPEILYYYRLHERSMTLQRREQIAHASRRVFAHAIARRHEQLVLEELYPTLPRCRDIQAARDQALLDLGALMMQSPFADPDAAVRVLEEARTHAPDSVAVTANLALALARAGRWEAALALGRSLVGTTDPTVRSIAAAVEAGATARRPDLLAGAPFFVPDKTHSELFRLERDRKRVFSVTDRSVGATEACLPVTPATAPSADPPGGQGDAQGGVAAAPAPAPASPEAAVRPPRPLVSVIVPTRDRPAMLGAALQSILQQTYPNVEIIVVNDAGMDVGYLLTALDHRGAITYVRHDRNRGLAAARNSGLRMARGTYVAYLDDDDRFHPHHLETLIALLETTSFRVAYSDACRVHQRRDGEAYVETGRDLPHSRDFDPDILLVANYFPVLTVVHERALLDEVGLFDENLTSHEDWDLWIRLSRRWPFAHLKVVTGEYTWRTDGSTMTSRMAADYRRTIEIIHARYREHAERVPGLVDAQRQFRASLQTAAATPRFDYSVIMPVHNRCDLTRQCIEALAQVTGNVQWELIVVDNGSTDDTTTFLSSVCGDLQVIRNAENLGFATACNQGAAAARGRHLVFLNNDTLPLSGWLAALGGETDSHPEVAVVGSKLLYRDGTVQHAGLAFARRIPLPYHIYCRWPADDAAVNTRREVQAVTGACMLVRREAFEKVGGFDTGYQNGFEDVDLCLRIRDQGWRVVYQPESVLYHFESQTPGRKLHDAANGRRFLERWGSRWWLADEDAIYVGDNRAARLVDCAGTRHVRVEPLTDGRERQRWELVAEAQRAGQRQDIETVRALLARLEEWPDDPGVREWAATIALRVGMPQRAEAAAPAQQRAGGPPAGGASGGDRGAASPV